ncbi:MAG: PIN domain-containing protein [Candidatus Aenigmatarchaeota archaeon]|nr:PIN domain-containing protein [Candidatus Aenigmarchaeota archaeon]
MKESKFLTLPVHHIDTSIILEKETTENGRYCKKYINIVGTKYRGIISLPVLSELFLSILRLENFSEQWDVLDLIKSILKEKKIAVYSPSNTFDIEARIANLDKRIQPLDRLILACASENNALLVTLDSNLLNNDKLENLLNIKIKHPKELI